MTARENLLDSAARILPSALPNARSSTGEELDSRFLEASESLVLTLALDPNAPYYLAKLITSEALSELSQLITASESILSALGQSFGTAQPPVVDRHFVLAQEAASRVSGRVTSGVAPETEDVASLVSELRNYAYAQLVPQENVVTVEKYRAQLQTDLQTISAILPSLVERLTAMRPGGFFVDNLYATLPASQQLSVYLARLQSNLEQQNVVLTNSSLPDKIEKSPILLADTATLIALSNVLLNLTFLKTRYRASGDGYVASVVNGTQYGEHSPARIQGEPEVAIVAAPAATAYITIPSYDASLVLDVDEGPSGLPAVSSTVVFPASSAPAPISVYSALGTWPTTKDNLVTLRCGVLQGGALVQYYLSMQVILSYPNFASFPLASFIGDYAYDVALGNYYRWNGAWVGPLASPPAINSTDYESILKGRGRLLDVYGAPGPVLTRAISITSSPTTLDFSLVAESVGVGTVTYGGTSLTFSNAQAFIFGDRVRIGSEVRTVVSGSGLSWTVNSAYTGSGTSTFGILPPWDAEGQGVFLEVQNSGTAMETPFGLAPFYTYSTGGQISGPDLLTDLSVDFVAAGVTAGMYARLGCSTNAPGVYRIVEVVSANVLRLFTGTPFVAEVGVPHETVESTTGGSRRSTGSGTPLSQIVAAFNTALPNDVVATEISGYRFEVVSARSGSEVSNVPLRASKLTVTGSPGLLQKLGLTAASWRGRCQAFYDQGATLKDTGIQAGMQVVFELPVAAAAYTSYGKFSDLPTTATEGDYAYVESTGDYYQYASGSWVQVFSDPSTYTSEVVVASENEVLRLRSDLLAGTTLTKFKIYAQGALSYKDTVELQSSNYTNALNNLIKDITDLEDYLARARQSVADMQRAVSYIHRVVGNPDTLIGPAYTLKSILSLYSSPATTSMSSVLNLLRERGFSQSVDYLLRGNVSGALLVSNASYSRSLQSTFNNMGMNA